MNKIKILCVLCVGLFMSVWGEAYTFNCNYIEKEECEDCPAPHKVSCGDREGFMKNSTPIHQIILVKKKYNGYLMTPFLTSDRIIRQELNSGRKFTVKDLEDKNLLASALIPLIPRNDTETMKISASDVEIDYFSVNTKTPLYSDSSATDQIATAGDLQYNCRYDRRNVVRLNAGVSGGFDGGMDRCPEGCRNERCQAVVFCSVEQKINNGKSNDFYGYSQPIVCASQGNSCPEDVMDCILDDSYKYARYKRSDQELKDLGKEFKRQREREQRRSGNSGGVQ